MTPTSNLEITKLEDDEFRIKTFDRISEIPEKDWDRCAGDENPAACHAYLNALEVSGAVSAKTGFKTHHIVAYDRTGKLCAVAPTYIKDNSDAEIGADMGWSMAHERMCGPYYPKLQVEIPFTPIPGSCFMVAPDQNRAALFNVLLNSLINIVIEKELSSLHINFISDELREFLTNAGLPINIGTQFQWESHGQQDFEEFLASLKGSKRQMIKKERLEVSKSGLEFEFLSGTTLTKEVMSQFYHLYVDTYDRYETQEFLPVDFFQLIRKSMPEKLILNAVKRNGDLIAATLVFKGSNMLFAHHWGCREYVKFLHFETTYYRAIDYCTQQGLSAVHGGSGGQHKSNRGYLPIATHHAHWFRNKDFEKAIVKGIEKKNKIIGVEQQKMFLSSPYKPQNTE